ncbi:hypothetical protein ACHQM5_012200 [Ranunculus cassubicifolius]
MESNQIDSPKLIISWEDYQNELARFCSLSSSLITSNNTKLHLQQKLDSLIQVRSESVSRRNELDEMRQKLEDRRLVLGNLIMRTKTKAVDVRNQEEQLNVQIKSLLVAGKARSLADKQLQEANRLLAGERGHARVKTLGKMLRTRLQYMVAQVSAVYPVKISIVPRQGEKVNSSAIVSRSGISPGSKPLTAGSLTISGLQLTALPIKKMSFFSDKKEIQKSATALGYIAHAVLLIGAYLDVPLRYSLRLGGSHSYINDFASSAESAISDSSSSPLLFTNLRATEFPLFLEGQDTTRAAYAIFLLNKDIEQLLNFIGVQSLGPRHVLANLKELLRAIQSKEFIDQ